MAGVVNPTCGTTNITSTNTKDSAATGPGTTVRTIQRCALCLCQACMSQLVNLCMFGVFRGVNKQVSNYADGEPLAGVCT